MNVHLRMRTGVNLVEEIKDCPRLRVNRVNECHKKKTSIKQQNSRCKTLSSVVSSVVVSSVVVSSVVVSSVVVSSVVVSSVVVSSVVVSSVVVSSVVVSSVVVSSVVVSSVVVSSVFVLSIGVMNTDDYYRMFYSRLRLPVMSRIIAHIYY